MKPLVLARAFFVVAMTTSSIVLPTDGQPQLASAGPNTADVQKIGVQGNWAKKREWLMKSHEAFSEIQELVNQTEQLRRIFIDKLNDTDRTLDTYYKGLGLSEGKINELFENINAYLEKKRKKDMSAVGASAERQDPELQAKIDIIESNIKHYTLQLEQLRLDMKAIEDLGKSLVDRIKRVDERLQTIQQEFTKAQTIINDLWDIIDHNKARDKYYELKITILETIRNEQQYLQQDLLADFDTVVQTIVAQIGRTESEIKTIEAEGLFIKNRAQRVKELKLKEAASKNAPAMGTSTQAAQKQPDDVKQAIVQHSFLQHLYQVCIDALAWIIDQCRWCKSLIFGGPSSALQQAMPPKAPVLPPSIPLQATTGLTTQPVNAQQPIPVPMPQTSPPSL